MPPVDDLAQLAGIMNSSENGQQTQAKKNNHPEDGAVWPRLISQAETTDASPCLTKICSRSGYWNLT